jgi:hypothetical protein
MRCVIRLTDARGWAGYFDEAPFSLRRHGWRRQEGADTEGPMAKLTPSRIVLLATLAAVAIGLVTPAFAIPYDRNRSERGDFIYVPGDGDCIANRGPCDLVRY